MRKRKGSRNSPLVEQEIPRVLKAAETVDDLIAVSLMLFSALRVGEVEELRVKDLDFNRDELPVRAEIAVEMGLVENGRWKCPCRAR